MTEPESPVRYREPGASYRTTCLLGGAIVVGFVLDMVFGGGVAHLIAWVAAFVLIVGAESLTVYAARVMRTVVITDDEIRVGEETVVRAGVHDVDYAGDADEHVLGRRYATGLPRGTQGVLLSQADGTRVIVATRHPERVLDVLGAEPVAPLAVRPAQAADLEALAEIDERSESLFRVAGYELPQFDPSPKAPRVQSVYVIGEPPVGFVELAEVDGEAYVNEVAVLPSHMRRGYGTQLMAAAARWARERGYRGVVLTTFADIEWNAPFYSRLGYVQLDAPGPGLAAIRAYEESVGLDDVGERIAMRLDL